MSYKTGTGRECLFLSRDAKLDGSKAVRGGVPLVFPQFGQPDTSMPQHGFLRISFWKVEEESAYDNEEAAGITYTLDLKDVQKGRGGAWAVDSTEYDCQCLYHIKFNGKSVTTTLEIENTGMNEFPFQALLHTYYAVAGHAAEDPSQCNVQGLEGYAVSDKVSKKEYLQGSDPVVMEGETDHVYTPTADGKKDVDVTVAVGGGQSVKIKGTAKVDGVDATVSCVVWNPHIAKAQSMSDFADDQWRDMVCVEPGILSGETLPPGKSAELTVTSTML